MKVNFNALNFRGKIVCDTYAGNNKLKIAFNPKDITKVSYDIKNGDTEIFISKDKKLSIHHWGNEAEKNAEHTMVLSSISCAATTNADVYLPVVQAKLKCKN